MVAGSSSASRASSSTTAATRSSKCWSGQTTGWIIHTQTAGKCHKKKRQACQRPTVTSSRRAKHVHRTYQGGKNHFMYLGSIFIPISSQMCSTLFTLRGKNSGNFIESGNFTQCTWSISLRRERCENMTWKLKKIHFSALETITRLC